MKKTLFFFFLGIIVFAFTWQSYQSIPATASAPGGYAVTQGTSSQITIPSGEVLQVFATSTSCVSRVVSSGVVDLWITLVDSATRPSVNVGHYHATSTTVGYDSGIYGCGLWRVYNGHASTATFTITEFNGFR